MDPPPSPLLGTTTLSPAPKRAQQTHEEKEEQIHTYTQNDARKRLRMLLQAFYWREFTGRWLCHNLDVPLRLQSGFNCGLVALRMGAEFISPEHALSSLSLNNDPKSKNDNVHTTALLSLAQQLGFTNEGEMFSSYDLGILAEKYYKLRVEVKKGYTSRDIITHLSSGYPILLPYDADPSFAPCVLNGKRPHWAIIRGFVVCTNPHYNNPNSDSSNPTGNIMVFAEVDGEDSAFSHTNKTSIDSTDLQQVLTSYDDDKLYLICQHGKSKNLALWAYTHVQQSNINLSKPDEKKKESGRWKIPDTLEHLQSHIILLHPPPL